MMVMVVALVTREKIVEDLLSMSNISSWTLEYCAR